MAAAAQDADQVVLGNGFAAGQGGLAPSLAFRFAHVAGPVVRLQSVRASGCKRLAGSPRLFAARGREACGSGGHVGPVFSHGSQLQAHHVQAAQRLGTEAPVSWLGVQVVVA